MTKLLDNVIIKNQEPLSLKQEVKEIFMSRKNKTLAETLSAKILEMIQNHPYLPGEKLPTEKELCAIFQSGRNTLREALKLLASRNIVVIRQGAGTYVSEKQGVVDDPFGFSLVNDRRQLTRDLLQTRAIIEPPIAALAAQCATEQEIAELLAILEEMEEVMKVRQDYSHLDVRFHSKIAQCTHNMVMVHLIPLIGNGVAVFAREVADAEYEQTFLSHRKIYEYIRDHKSFEAEMEMRFHLLYNQNRYVNPLV